MKTERSAYVLRISPSGIDRVDDALAQDQIIIGWAAAQDLLDPNLEWLEFREIIHRAHYDGEETYRRSGGAAGQMWRFIREMAIGDYVVVPHGASFHVAEITGPATYQKDLVDDDTAYRRVVTWLNSKQPIPRRFARAALISRMKYQGTCVEATEILRDIDDVLEVAASGAEPSFDTDLRQKLIAETVAELRSGRLDDFRFEVLLSGVLCGLGARESRIVPRSLDKGADILATFEVARAFQLRVAVQAKHYQPDPPVGIAAIDEIARGMEAEDASLGLVITSGQFAPEAMSAAQAYYDSEGKRIELIDGEQLAALIIDNGLTGRSLVQ